MPANELTSKEYEDIATQSAAFVGYASGAVKISAEYARRMASSMSVVDNCYLADALDVLSRSLVAVGEDAERVRLRAIRCQTEAMLRENEDQPEDKENTNE